MSDNELVEAVARAIAKSFNGNESGEVHWPNFVREGRAALSVARPLIAADAMIEGARRMREKAANVAGSLAGEAGVNYTRNFMTKHSSAEFVMGVQVGRAILALNPEDVVKEEG